MATLNRVVRWLRQVLCFHGPTDHVPFEVEQEDDIYAADICRRCKKVLLKYSNA